MLAEKGYIEFLRQLPRSELDRSIERTLCDTLEQLGVAIAAAVAVRGRCLNGCVIDDLQVARTDLGEAECRVVLRFGASARRGRTRGADSERLSGNAEVSIDENGCVTYLGITLAEEVGFVAHDEGGEG